MREVSNEVKRIERESIKGKMDFIAEEFNVDLSNKDEVKDIMNNENLNSIFEHESYLFKIPRFGLGTEFGHDYICNFNISDTEDYYYISGNLKQWYKLINIRNKYNSDGSEALNGLNALNKHFSTILSELFPTMFKNEKYMANSIGFSYGEFAENDLDESLKNFHKLETFKIRCSKHLASELRKFKFFSISEKELPEEIEFIENELPIRILEEIEECYKESKNEKLLPLTTATTIIISATNDNWRKYLKYILNTEDEELKKVATLIKEILSINDEDLIDVVED